MGRVSGQFVISKNDALTSLDGLNSLESVGNSLYIFDNDALTSLKGLDSLQSVNSDLDIRYNSALTSLDGLDSLENVGGRCLIGPPTGWIDSAPENVANACRN